MRTAIQIINASSEELGLPTVSISTAGPDDLGPQLLTLLNGLGEELLRVHDWQFLLQTYDLVGDGVTSRFPLPDDFFRIVNQTEWDTANRRPLMGPQSPQMWGWNLYGLVGTGIFYRYRIIGNEFEVWPTPPDQATFSFFYISKLWVEDASNPGTFLDRVYAQDDIPLYDDRMMIAGLKVKLWSIKGLNTVTLQREFADLLAAYKAQNAGAPTINLAGGTGEYLISWYNVPDGSVYGGP